MQGIIVLVVVIGLILFWIREGEYQRLEREYLKLEGEVFQYLGFSSWDVYPHINALIVVKSRQAFQSYDSIKYFKENKEKLDEAEKIIARKLEIITIWKNFLEDNEFKSYPQYSRLVKRIYYFLNRYEQTYTINVKYITASKNCLESKELVVSAEEIAKFKENPQLLMDKGEYNRFLKEQHKKALSEMHQEFYDYLNDVIDYVNENKDSLVLKGSPEQMDKLVAQLFDRTVNSVKKNKNVDSEEWSLIENFTNQIATEIGKIIEANQKMLAYYQSPEFLKIKETCEVLMSSQREFNEYITEKVQSISKLFGTKVMRNETLNDDVYNYIRAYKKNVTPFTAEVSAAVFASAENNPLEYVVKNFYPDKSVYPEQLRKLYLLVEELETLREAKQIIENYKAEYQQYLGEVPDYIMENDEAGFYSRLGFANIDEGVLAVEYKFVYTSGGGFAQRSFTVPMTEETIADLIHILERKLTAKAFAKEQRTLMTRKLREQIKIRDNFTCCYCANSIYAEANLLLEIDHIIPVAKGGCTTEENLQTLCWKCNRSKSDKIVETE